MAKLYGHNQTSGFQGLREREELTSKGQREGIWRMMGPYLDCDDGYMTAHLSKLFELNVKKNEFYYM